LSKNVRKLQATGGGDFFTHTVKQIRLKTDTIIISYCNVTETQSDEITRKEPLQNLANKIKIVPQKILFSNSSKQFLIFIYICFQWKSRIIMRIQPLYGHHSLQP